MSAITHRCGHTTEAVERSWHTAQTLCPACHASHRRRETRRQTRSATTRPAIMHRALSGGISPEALAYMDGEDPHNDEVFEVLDQDGN